MMDESKQQLSKEQLVKQKHKEYKQKLTIAVENYLKLAKEDENKMNELIQKCQQLEEWKVTFEKEFESIKQVNKTLEAENQQQKSQIFDLNTSLDSLNQQIAEQGDGIDKQQYQEFIKQKDTTISELQEKIKEQSLLLEKSQHSNDYEKLKQEYEHLKYKYHKQQMQLDDQQDRIGQLIQSCNESQSLQSSLSLSGLYRSKKLQDDSLYHELQNVKYTCEILQKQLKQANNKNQKLQQTCEDLQDQIFYLKRKKGDNIVNSEIQILQMDKKIKQLEAQIKEYDSELIMYKSHQQDFEKQALDTFKITSQTHQQPKQNDELYEEVKKQIVALNNTVQIQDYTIEQLQNTIIKLEEQLTSMYNTTIVGLYDYIEKQVMLMMAQNDLCDSQSEEQIKCLKKIAKKAKKLIAYTDDD